MAGTWLNVVFVVLGAGLGLTRRAEPSASTQSTLKVLLGAFTVWAGLSILWRSMHGSWLQVLGQFGITVLAMSLGHATGRLTRIQSAFNRLGQIAASYLSASPSGVLPDGSRVFLGVTILCLANPLGLYGALLEGTTGHWEVLLIKAILDGLSCLAVARRGGWPVLGAALPLLAGLGTVTLVAQSLARTALSPVMVDAIGATGGMMVFSVALVMFGLRRIELANYLPSLIYAPLLAWWWR